MFFDLIHVKFRTMLIWVLIFSLCHFTSCADKTKPNTSGSADILEQRKNDIHIDNRSAQSALQGEGLDGSQKMVSTQDHLNSVKWESAPSQIGQTPFRENSISTETDSFISVDDVSEMETNHHKDPETISQHEPSQKLVSDLVAEEDARKPLDHDKKRTSLDPQDIQLTDIHKKWDDMLQDYVTADGTVDYTSWSKMSSDLDTYLALLSSNVPDKGDKSKEAMAFWVNAYNAFTIKLILSRFPISSIRDIDQGNPWDTKWIKLGGETYSLNNIEHDILRAVWKDPRIHFAVNCAAQSCPPLHNRAITKDNIDDKFDLLTNNFINNTKFNTLEPNKLVLSRIFDWYKSDFGSLVSYVQKYAKVSIASNAEVTFHNYSWDLNGK